MAKLVAVPSQPKRYLAARPINIDGLIGALDLARTG